MVFPITKLSYNEPLGNKLSAERNIETGGSVKFLAPTPDHNNQFWIASNAFSTVGGKSVIAFSDKFDTTQSIDRIELLLDVIKNKKYKFIYVEFNDEVV